MQLAQIINGYYHKYFKFSFVPLSLLVGSSSCVTRLPTLKPSPQIIHSSNMLQGF